ncbi:MAG: protein kinase [Holophagales bacterium]|nr:protein kinase [Holophagales bacterium]
MGLSPGSRLGSYEITAPLGEGGMGVVYRATDSKLKREVAIKVLPEALAADADRLARFEREAQVLAQLQHPNIASIYGLEESNGVRALVMELVPGEDLSERLKRGPLPLDEALAVARQIAEALEEAHEKGIVHRDLKPANVKLTPEGKVKVLDFGLAKAMDPAAGSASAADLGRSPTMMNSPTMTAARGTQLGVILGTAAYMAPEQARGQTVDKRADIWSFGVVLSEMLTGKGLFRGETVTDVLASVVREPIAWDALPPETPASVRALLRRCLERDPKNRMRDVGEARIALVQASAPSADAPPPVRAADPPVARGRWPVVLAAAAAAAIVTFGLTRGLVSPGAATAARSARVSIALPEGHELGSSQLNPIAISRDGARVAYVGLRDGRNRIFVRALDALEATALEGTEGGDGPFFSPDGRWIGFFAGSKLRKIAVGGAALQELAEAPSHRGGDWGGDGYLYFAPANISGIWRVPEGGGTATEVTHVNAAAGEISHRWPHRVAGTDTLLYSVWTGPGDDEHHVAVQTLGKKEHHLLVKGGDAPRYAAGPGLLLYTHRGQLFTVPWRPSQQDLGGAVPVAAAEQPNDGIGNEGCGNYAVSDDGTLAYLGGGRISAMRLVWVDRANALAPLPLPERAYENVAISPDGGRAVVQIREGTTRLWIYDFARGTLTPLGPATASSQAPLWTPDGTHVIYRGTRQGTRNLYRIPVDGSGDEERLTSKAGVIQTPSSISSDGRVLLFDQNGPAEAGGVGAWVLPLEGDRTPRRLFPLPATGRDAQISPDGRWVAYEAIVSSRQEVFVAPLSGAGERRLVSTEGGTEPLWSRDGRELFFQSGTRLMGVTVTPGATFSASLPRVVHEGRFFRTINGNTSFSITRDGARFLRIQPVNPEPAIRRIELVLDWFSGLKSRGSTR